MRSSVRTALVMLGLASSACLLAFLKAYPGSGITTYTKFSEEDQEFMRFVARYDKSFGTKEEYEARSWIFKTNLDLIRQHAGDSFTLGLNKFADWTQEEYRKLRNPRRAQRNKGGKSLNAVNVPTNVDWRLDGAVTPVLDMGGCGAGYAFSSIGAIESGWKIKNGGSLYQLSVQQFIDCQTLPPYNNSGCNGGGSVKEAILYAQDQGVVQAKDYPFDGFNGPCRLRPGDVVVSTQGNFAVQPNSSKDLKAAIALAPVSVGVDSGSFVFQFYSGGILNSQGCGTDIDHSVVAIGYGVDSVKGEYYIIKNSWGRTWGLQGYAYLAIVDGPGICGVQVDPNLPLF